MNLGPRLLAFLFFANSLIVNVLAQVKSPSEFLPHALGDQFTPHAWQVDYFEHVAANCPKTVRLERFGATYESRPQQIAVVSSAENIARLEDIRKAHLEASEGKKNASKIAVVWLGYSVHGNEAAGAEAAMQVLFDLATQAKKGMADWLKNTVVIIDGAQNPDGYDHYSHWNRMASNRWPQRIAGSREHLEPWPGGRPNHYYFDLNRDWAWLTQVESQNRIRKYHDWLPHVHADIHEQYFDNPYYFAPAAEPFHEIITPFQRQFQHEIGQNHAKYFDSEGWLYFTREQFDLLYPSYGDTYPTYNGAIGMTYEQGGIRAGRGIFTETGDSLDLADRVLHHYMTSISTVEIASKNAERLCENFENYFDSARKTPRGQWKSFVFKNRAGDERKIDALLELLKNHKIEFGTAGKNSSEKGHNYRTGREENVVVAEGDVVVSCFQKHSDMAVALLEPQTRLVDSSTYDITAWSLPLAFGLEAFALKTRLEPQNAWAGCSFSPIPPSGKPAYAYVARWQDHASARFLAECLKKGLNVRSASGAFKIEGQNFDAGSLILTRADNEDLGDGFKKRVAEAASLAKIDLFQTKTGFVEVGQDFGSDGQKLIRRPSIALVYDDDCDENALGHIWWHFERELEYPISAIPRSSVERGLLRDFNTLIFPEGAYSLEKMDALKDWIAGGGRVVAYGNAVKIFADKDGFDLKTKPADDRKDEKTPAPRAFGARFRSALSSELFGAIVENQVDPTNPLAFGLGDRYFSLKTNGAAYEFLGKASQNAVWIGDDFVSYGFIGSRLRPRLKKTLTVGSQRMGKGSVVFLADPPVFRGFWQQGKLLFDNALFF